MDSMQTRQTETLILHPSVSLTLHCYNSRSTVVFCFNVIHPIRLQIEFLIKIFEDRLIYFRKMYGYHLGKQCLRQGCLSISLIILLLCELLGAEAIYV